MFGTAWAMHGAGITASPMQRWFHSFYLLELETVEPGFIMISVCSDHHCVVHWSVLLYTTVFVQMSLWLNCSRNDAECIVIERVCI